MVGPSLGRGTLTAALLAGGGAFVALGLWNAPASAEHAQFVRLGAVWMLFGVAQAVVSSGRSGKWASGGSRLRCTLLGGGIALVLVGFVVSGPFLLWFGAVGLLSVAVSILAGSGGDS